MYTPEQKKELRETNPFRNVAEKWKGFDTEEIRSAMREMSYPMVSICENLVGDFNIAQIVRSSNAFALLEVSICGSRQWDRRGAVGTHHYIDINYYSNTIEAIEYWRSLGFTIIAAELTDDAQSLHEFEWPDKVAVVYGEEGKGITEEALNAVDHVVFIPQRGTVRSLNVAGAAQIFMFDYCRTR